MNSVDDNNVFGSRDPYYSTSSNTIISKLWPAGRPHDNHLLKIIKKYRNESLFS